MQGNKLSLKEALQSGALSYELQGMRRDNNAFAKNNCK